jgi:peptide/nickel transport system substrate-binding protein
MLRRDRKIAVEIVETAGLISVLRFNHLQPGTNNPAVRRVLLNTLNQR